MKAQIPWLRVLVEGVVIVGKLAIVLSFVGCAYKAQSTGVSAAAPDDTFSCYVRVLAQMEYNWGEELDRSSGFIRAVKREGADQRSLRGLAFGLEANVAIVPDSSTGGSDVTVRIRRIHLQTRNGFHPMLDEGWEDLEALSEACVS